MFPDGCSTSFDRSICFVVWGRIFELIRVAGLGLWLEACKPIRSELFTCMVGGLMERHAVCCKARLSRLRAWFFWLVTLMMNTSNWTVKQIFKKLESSKRLWAVHQFKGLQQRFSNFRGIVIKSITKHSNSKYRFYKCVFVGIRLRNVFANWASNCLNDLFASGIQNIGVVLMHLIYRRKLSFSTYLISNYVNTMVWFYWFFATFKGKVTGVSNEGEDCRTIWRSSLSNLFQSPSGYVLLASDKCTTAEVNSCKFSFPTIQRTFFCSTNPGKMR